MKLNRAKNEAIYLTATDIATYSYCSLKWALSHSIETPSISEARKKISYLKSLPERSAEQEAQLKFLLKLIAKSSRLHYGAKMHRRLSLSVLILPIIIITLLLLIVWMFFRLAH